jgi:hypothetical protein
VGPVQVDILSYVPDVFGIQLLEVQITPRGRKVVRSATGEQRVRPPPKGQLRERQWAALVRLYAAGDAGEESWDMMYGRGGFDWFRTLLRLRDYSGGALMEEYRAPDVSPRHQPVPRSHWGYRMRITSFGRDYYAREWARYRELYPVIDAPQPPEETPTDG